MSLAAYRNILRAARIAFQGDAHVLAAAQVQIRQGFQENRSLDSSSTIQGAIRHAEDVATILRQNVVQGRKMDESQHTYKLRIHEHTERGDNETILTAGNQTRSSGAGGGCGCR